MNYEFKDMCLNKRTTRVGEWGWAGETLLGRTQSGSHRMGRRKMSDKEQGRHSVKNRVTWMQR